MRSLIAVAVLALPSCALAQQAVIDATEDDASATTTTVTGGPHNGWWLQPNADPADMCTGGYGASIPCNQVINVCHVNPDGRLTPKWPLGANGCTADSPTVRDVCLTAPVDHRPFYGYTYEECEVEINGR